MIPFCEKCESRYQAFIDNIKEEMFLECPDCHKIIIDFDFSKMTVADLIDLKEAEFRDE